MPSHYLKILNIHVYILSTVWMPSNLRPDFRTFAVAAVIIRRIALVFSSAVKIGRFDKNVVLLSELK